MASLKGNASELLIAAEVSALLVQEGCIDAVSENFVPAKFQDLATDLDIAGKVEAILKKHGVVIPTKVDQVLMLLPELAGLLGLGK